MHQPTPTTAATPRPTVRRRHRRLAAVALGVLGVGAIALSLAGGSDEPALIPARTAGSLTHEAPADGTVPATDAPTGSTSGETPTTEAREPTDGPGGVGRAPEKTGLPAKPADGLVRTGTEEEGCFADLRSYLEEWHRTEVEPDPCFTSQPASGQKQPDGVKRSYNGEKF